MCQGFFPSLLSMSLVFSAWDISPAFAIILRCYASSWGLWCHKLWTSCLILISFLPSFVDMVSCIKDLFAIYCGLLPYHEDFCLTIYEVFLGVSTPKLHPQQGVGLALCANDQMFFISTWWHTYMNYAFMYIFCGLVLNEHIPSYRNMGHLSPLLSPCIIYTPSCRPPPTWPSLFILKCFSIIRA